ncbi:MAG: nucleotidyltransferase family protein, partial [Acidimicrobiales bacterium]
MNLATALPVAPEVPAATLLARRIAAYGLGGPDAHNAAGSLAGQPLGQGEWSVLLGIALRERMVGLLACAVADAALATTDDQAAEVHEAHVAALCGDLVRERELIRLVGVLWGSGLDHRVLKGAAVAHLDYPDPALRSFADVDLLVRAEEWDDAIQVLREAGWERQFAEPRPGFER